MSKKIRTRYAPSPTGFQHIGGVRTALFAYLFAQKHNGALVLRIEDTDQSRYVEGAEQYIVDTLNWLDVKPDEGVGYGGDYGPYRQSERSDLYRKHVMTLLENGSAYYAFDTPEELNAKREAVPNFKYDSKTRNEMRNSLTLPVEEIEKLMNDDVAYVIRLKIPGDEVVAFDDIVRGEVKFQSNELDDKVLFKSDGLPTYHLANVVDDHLMEISHVIRGEEWLSSTPLHVLLYRGFGWEDTMPKFAHLPLLLNPNGKGKLSKRAADKLGFPVFPLAWVHPTEDKSSTGFKENGYMPDAFLNFLAFQGWNPGTEQEIFTREDLVKSFSLDRVIKAGSKFNIDKAKWYNEEYLKLKSDAELAQLIEAEKPKEIEATTAQIEKLAPLFKERLSFAADFWSKARFLFEKPKEFDAKVMKKKWKPENVAELKKIQAQLDQVNDFTPENTAKVVKGHIEKNELSFGNIFQPLRMLLTGQASGPDLFEMMTALGKEECMERFTHAFDNF